ncbi:MAG: 2'-5' RNA ligase family protein, partial [Myxococcota bacterium]
FGAIGDGRFAVAQLGNDIEMALVPLGFEPERRSRVPHVTIARVEGARRRGKLSRWIENVEPRVYGPVLDGAVVLYESELDPGGSIYTALATLAIGAA